MNIKELKEQLKDLQDNIEVVITDSEWWFNKFDKVLTKQLKNYNWNWCIEFQEWEWENFITLE